MDSKPRILLIGPPGAGKTVIATKLSEILSIPFIKVGALLRDLSQSDENYQLIRDAMVKGELAPNNLVAEVVRKAVDEKMNGYIIDGWLRQLSDMNEYNPDLDYVIFLDCPKEICKDRILNRVVCKIDNTIYSFSDTVCDLCGGELEKRTDDTDETFENRWNVFTEKTLPVLNYFEEKKKLIKVDASRSIPEIVDQINKSLWLLIKHQKK